MAFALLDCLPGMALTMLLFHNRLRFSPRTTIILCAMLVAIQMAAGLLRCGHINDNTYMAAMAVLIPALWGLPTIALIRESWRKTVFVMMLFMNLSGTVTIIGNALGQQIFPDGKNLPYSWRYLMMVTLVGTVLLGLLSALFGKTLLELFRFRDMDHIWRYLWLVPVGFSAIALWMRFGTPEPEYISTAKPANYFMLMLLFATKLGTYLIISQIILIQRERNELRIINRQYELHERAYHIYRERDKAERRLRHDFRHQLAVLAVLAEKGEFTQLRDYINSMVSVIPSNVQYRFAADPELDALLQCYRYEAERSNVEFRSRIEAPIERYIESVNLTVILGNLLENAVQAASQTDSERWVDVRICKVSNVCMILIRNTYDGSLTKMDGAFLSTKHEGMGMGLESVKLIVKRLYGECSISHTDRIFAVRVSLPAEESTSRDSESVHSPKAAMPSACDASQS